MPPAPKVRLLWQHQQNALDRVRDYLARPAAETEAHAALVRMPTGAGKGGVIAGIARATDDVEFTVVVTPSVALRDQIVDEVARIPWGKKPTPSATAVAWDSIDAMAVVGNNARVGLPPVTSDGRRRMLALTTSALVDIAANDPALYSALRSAIDVLIFDEGHREPAPQWAEAIRGLEAPVVLFTATPCRNDHELFRVVPQHTYVLAYQEAVKLRFVRSVGFERYPFAGDPEEFATALFGLLMTEARGFAEAVGAQSSGAGVVPSSVRDRAIVRCGSFVAVDDVAASLNALGVPVLALHEQYRHVSRAWGMTDVPPRGARGDAVVWVAEDKLVEGIDDPSFRFLGIYQGFGDSRALVQQIGRVTRRPASDQAVNAVVLIDDASEDEERWQEYLLYESKADTAPPVFGAHDLARAITREVPEALYLERRYRIPFDIDGTDAHLALNYPAHATVGRVGPNFDRGKCRDHVVEEIRSTGADVHVFQRDPDNADVLLYVVARSARVVRAGFWPETELHVLTLIQRGNLLFCTDTGRHVPAAVRAMTSRVSRADLERLLATDRHRIDEVTLAHTRPGPGAVRRRAMQMDSLDDIAGDANDTLHTCRNARAVIEPSGGGRRRRRYVGFSTDRISELSRADMPYGEYLGWIDEAVTAISGTGPRPKSLKRFALDVDVGQLKPVAFELAGADLASRYATTAGVPLDLDPTTYRLANGRCVVSVRVDGGNRIFPFRLRWVSTARAGQGAFVVESVELDDAFVAQGGTDAAGRSVSEFLTTEQRFTVYFADGTIVYADGAYHRVDRLARGADGFWLANHLPTVPGLDIPIKEKGPVVSLNGHSTWDKDSIFGWIDRRGDAGPDPAKSALRERLATASLLVCDDMGTESSDFIAADVTNRWVAFIHAKERKARTKKGKGASTTSGARRLSATSLAEVCGQAEKNLTHLLEDARELKKRAGDWDIPWPNSKRAEIPRVRFGATDAAAAYSIIHDLLRAPDARREVWIVMSGAFSLAELRRRREDVSRPAWVAAMEMQLQSTATAIRAAGAQFRFFCAP